MNGDEEPDHDAEQPSSQTPPPRTMRSRLADLIAWSTFVLLLVGAIAAVLFLTSSLSLKMQTMAEQGRAFIEQQQARIAATDDAPLILVERDPAPAPPVMLDPAERPELPERSVASDFTDRNKPGALLTNPDWVERPDASAMARLYPRAAMAASLGGGAVVECAVNLEGQLEACVVISESPEGYGFGEATLNAARLFRLTPQLRDGVPVAGARVRIPINWRLG